MPLDCRICCLLCLFTVAVRGFDHSPLDIDKALNPRLVGAIYQLYKPTQAPPKVPISIDCNHPDVICRFGTGALLTTTGTKECNCKEPTGNVPIITGLVTPQVNKNSDIQNIKTDEATVPLKSSEKEKEVPVYHGIIDTEAVLNEADRPYNIWNFQRNSLERGWRASQNPIKPRVGELPRKFYSYYPFSDPPLSEEYYTQLSQSIPDPDDDDDDFFPFSKHSGSVSHQKTTKRPPFTPQNNPTTVKVINPTISDTRKTSAVKGGNVKS